VIKSRIMRWEWYMARMGDRRDVHRALVENPEDNRALERRSHTWEDLKM
jgi:hypothetical protein